jgi:hypothetical protein
MDNSAQRQQLSNAYNTAKKSFGFRAKLMPASIATDYAKAQLIAMGQGTTAKQLTNKDMKKIKRAVLDKKNKDKLIEATLGIQQQDKSKAENFLNELGLSHLAPSADILLKTANPHQGQLIKQAATNPESAAKMGIDPQLSAQLASDPKIAEQISANPELASQMLDSNVKTVEKIGDNSLDLNERTKVLKEQAQQKLKDYGKVLSPWLLTRLDTIENLFWKEPCFSGSKDIQENDILEDGNYNGSSFSDVFWRGYYGLSELPIFGWSKFSNITRSDFPNIYNIAIPAPTIAKFLYCFFVKICGAPLYIAYLAARFIYMMLRALIMKIPLLGVCIANTFIYIYFAIFGTVPSDDNLISWFYVEVIMDDNGNLKKDKIEYKPAFLSLFAGLFGLSIPYQAFDVDMGQKYGRGEIGVFIFIVMAASAILITLTGINVIVIMLAFFYFMFKTFLGIKDKALGKDLRKGGQST